LVSLHTILEAIFGYEEFCDIWIILSKDWSSLDLRYRVKYWCIFFGFVSSHSFWYQALQELIMFLRHGLYIIGTLNLKLRHPVIISDFSFAVVIYQVHLLCRYSLHVSCANSKVIGWWNWRNSSPPHSEDSLASLSKRIVLSCRYPIQSYYADLVTMDNVNTHELHKVMRKHEDLIQAN
jgi:hypothetical protein